MGGALKQPEINQFLEGSTTTLTADTVTTPGVTLGSIAGAEFPTLTFSTGSASDLKSCLGDADGDTTNNVDVENWDHGSVLDTSSYDLQNPHLVKLVDNTNGNNPIYSLLFWTADDAAFYLANTVSATTGYTEIPLTTDLDIFTTDSYLDLIYYDA